MRRFIEREITPHHERWRRPAGEVDRELWRKAGAAGLLCPNLPEAYGGAGGDHVFNVVIIESWRAPDGHARPRWKTPWAVGRWG